MLYANMREDFPAPNVFNLHTFSLAFDATNEIVYWTVNTGRTNGELGTALNYEVELYSLSVKGLTASSTTSRDDVKLETTFMQVAQHWYMDLEAGCDGP